jgi:PIN domain nuclease of toxin-antitoxin system
MAHKHVVDAHALVWNLEDNPKLGAQAEVLFDDPASEFALPLIALAEAADLVAKGRTSIPSVGDLMSSVLADPRFELIPLSLPVLQLSLGLTVLPDIHDRLIVATVLYLQSLGHTADLLTRDALITQSGLVPVVW